MENLVSKRKQCHHNVNVSCDSCSLSAICLPLSLPLNDVDRLDNIIERGRPLHKGDFLYQAGEPFNAVYAVRSGCVKTFSITSDWQEQVTGFYLPGELLGMDGLGSEKYTNTAIALETSAVCEIPFSRLQELSLKIPSLQRHFFQLIGKEISSEQDLIVQLSKSSAEERIASLILSISSRNYRRKLSGKAFRLPMSRSDIGNYLGLTVETVSRILGRFQKNKLLDVNMKEISILDMEGLQRAANVKISESCN